ncbi:Piso0_001710 [Millerozyma farinosa CBS 7064]|uniref:Long chronological lifespan protein 2 n=1 Tax=Pichia sorbitophila (strain ATCC MYA-4447 / BCRC 22081 / CBS 7064 / NBRC 10061 / NRRL Y-12695) TaxID=559304 RepID=G8YNW4_PICSO|nr:Piso0_001710 [Millerozyma farinosa CBS 7064]
MRVVWISLFLTAASANLFDFIQQQFHADRGQQQNGNEMDEKSMLSGCNKFLCSDTKACVDSPDHCPCPFPSSQLRCVLPDGKYTCISKPAGDISYKYDHPHTNWKIDAKDDSVRDCGWVTRAWRGLV